MKLQSERKNRNKHKPMPSIFFYLARDLFGSLFRVITVIYLVYYPISPTLFPAHPVPPKTGSREHSKVTDGQAPTHPSNVDHRGSDERMEPSVPVTRN
jgi:hypothetical protein